MTQSGGDFLQTTILTTPTGEKRASARIALAHGAGQADEVYFTWHDDRLYELPVAWLHPLKRWGASPFDPYGAADFSRETTTRCLECHNTWFEHVPGTFNQYKRDSFILGVTCERCHGPGRDHVAFHKAHPAEKSGHAVVHPGRLSRDRQLDLCAQCHSNAIKPRDPPFSYRPGDVLEAHFRTNLNTRREEDHVANQVFYLRQSKCFQNSETLTCITCHSPHQRSSALVLQQSCSQCHKPEDCGERDRLPVGVRDNCVGCHMPRFTRIQVFFQTEDDQYVPAIRPHEHRIAVYPEARKEVLLTWYRSQPDETSRQEADRLAKELGERWLDEADSFRHEYRYMAAMGTLREAERIDPTPATRAKLNEVIAIQAKLDADWFTALHQIDEKQTTEAAATLNQMLGIKPNLAKAHGRLGTLHALAGQNEQAVEQLRLVAQYDPDDPYGYSMLGWLAYLQDKPAEAVEAYRRADEIEPFDAKINYHMGLAQAKLGCLPEAAACFRKVLAIDPNHAGGCQALADALRRLAKPDQAVHFARRAARLTDYQNADVLLTLAETYADAGRLADADDAAAKALDAAHATAPELVPLIRSRRHGFRERAK
jgi:tetratricopeptide (TPR) repeat protein